MQEILRAEQDAERLIQECTASARQIIKDAHARAQKIHARTDQRIANMEMRHSHKLGRLLRKIADQGAAERRNEAGHGYASDVLAPIVAALASRLCEDESDHTLDSDNGT